MKLYLILNVIYSMKVIEKMFGCGAHMCNYKNIRSLVPTSGYNFDCKWTVENILDEIKRK